MTARVRVRGVYATALTHLLGEVGPDGTAVEVVQASPPIRRRFDGEFDVAQQDVRVDTTDDRQGVAVSGDPEGVETVTDALAAVGEDTFTWETPLPRGAVCDGVVEETLGGGAVLDLGDCEGYLPYGNAEQRVEEGDRFRVQVRDPAPPWADERAVLDTDLRVGGGVATLRFGRDALVAGTPDGTAEHELVGLTEMLPTDVPERWAVEWGYAAEDAGMDALDAALDAAAERAGAVEEALAEEGEPGEPGVLAARETAWAWFGRDSRFALDAERRAVAATMAGHHRVKAAARGASDAVDFVEGVCGGVESFPLAATLAQFGPAEGDSVAIEHGKPEGQLITLGRGTVREVEPSEGRVTVRREMSGRGTYDGLGVERVAGDTATTRFTEGRQWYPTVYRDEEGTVKGTYINVCTPVEVFPDSVRYVDLHVDVIKHADGTVEVVDDDELAAAVEAGHVGPDLAASARDVAERVADGLRE